jgi:hypothetical protein
VDDVMLLIDAPAVTVTVEITALRSVFVATKRLMKRCASYS